jgi:hypothetical protein
VAEVPPGDRGSPDRGLARESEPEARCDYDRRGETGGGREEDRSDRGSPIKDRSVKGLHNEYCTDESIRTERGGVTHVVRQVFGSVNRDVWWVVALGFSLAVNLIAILSWRHAATEAQVKDYNLTFFMTHDWVDYKVKVETDHQLIESYWPHKASQQEKTRWQAEE